MKIYRIQTISAFGITNHGFFDYVECQAKLRDLGLKDNVEKIEIIFDSVTTYTKKENNNV